MNHPLSADAPHEAELCRYRMPAPKSKVDPSGLTWTTGRKDDKSSLCKGLILSFHHHDHHFIQAFRFVMFFFWLVPYFCVCAVIIVRYNTPLIWIQGRLHRSQHCGQAMSCLQSVSTKKEEKGFGLRWYLGGCFSKTSWTLTWQPEETCYVIFLRSWFPTKAKKTKNWNLQSQISDITKYVWNTFRNEL